MADRESLIVLRKVRAARLLAHASAVCFYVMLPPFVILNAGLAVERQMLFMVIWFGVASLGSHFFHGVVSHLVDGYRDRLIDGWIDHRASTLCPRCGYDLRGLDAGVCPECGGGER